MSALQVDELSIDSNTDRKIQIQPNKEYHQESVGGSTHSKASSSAKPHFRIDWRQLTYYKKERRSLASHLWCNNKRAGKRARSSSLNSDEDDDNENEDELDSATGGSPGQSYLEEGRLSRTSNESAGARKRRPILNSLDGSFRSGELSAILGPSGAGKSTFLSALFGNKQESSYGQTKVTWFPPQEDQTRDGATPPPAPNTKRSVRIAILSQQDHLLNHLTVYETLMFASKIKNPHKANCESFHRSNVRRVAETLKLTECIQTRCGRLSGGQYKRVSIGQELLSEPDVIILDEPTSGLDAMTCLTTIRTLKSIASKHPISIILTIHQPDVDVFNLFDKVYVIAQGGLAIYEGPPSGVAPTLARVNLFMPSDTYNPARFIVENAFVAAPEMDADSISCMLDDNHQVSDEDDTTSIRDEAEASDSDDKDDEVGRKLGGGNAAASFLRQSLSSITGALSGQPLKEPSGDLSQAPKTATGLLLGKGIDKRFRDSGRQPLLNIGIQTTDGKLITSDQLTNAGSSRQQSRVALMESEMRRRTLERMRTLKRLNELQKERYYNAMGALVDGSFTFSDILSQQTSLSITEDHHQHAADAASRPISVNSGTLRPVSPGASSAASYWAEARDQLEPNDSDQLDHQHNGGDARRQFTLNVPTDGDLVLAAANGKPPGANGVAISCKQTAAADHQSIHLDVMQLIEVGDGGGGGGSERYSAATTKCESSTLSTRPRGAKLRRQFDKRLSAKRVQSKRGEHPIWYHSFLLTHRTWLSIVRDPVFFGIQFGMHTTIPILLALIFGSHQEEGCPRVGNLDLVEFAYADERQDFLAGTMHSIRKSIGNVGVVFFEMFVLSFAINCITALVFPLDMYVLLKEHRNGWYSLKSYFFGRTMADLPVPIVLHSMAMSILCYMTGQPLTWWRFLAIIGIVILASLVAQSVGLTIGALLMRSSQSAVLAAAGIVAPFFALSGFIVRIHTLPWAAQWAAQGSYLYHLLNGFIVMRYGFGRCPCSEQDFEPVEAHQIPGNIKTMASMWVGTYSNEFESSPQMLDQLHQHAGRNRTNIDPNIDIIDKLMSAFKMANSFGHKVDTCNDVLPYAMLDFNLRDADIWHVFLSLVLMLFISRFITFSAIYYKIRSFS